MCDNVVRARVFPFYTNFNLFHQIHSFRCLPPINFFMTRWNLTVGAARPNPQGSFNVSNVTLSQTFVLESTVAQIHDLPRYVVNNVSYYTVPTPLKLADYCVNGSGVYQLDTFPVKSENSTDASYGVSVVTGIHKGWIEIVFKNDLFVMDSWHFDGFGFFVVG